MRIAMVHRWPDEMRGSERSMHLAATELRKAGHEVFLLHGCADAPRTGEAYDGAIGHPVLFDAQSKLPPASLGLHEARVEAWLTERRVDVVHVHYPPRTDTLWRWAHAHPVVVTAHAPLCPSGLRYLWRWRKECTRTGGRLQCLGGYFHDGCGRLASGTPYGVLTFLRRILDDRLYYLALREVRRIIAPSEWARQRLIADGAIPHRIRVLAPPIVEPPTAPVTSLPEVAEVSDVARDAGEADSATTRVPSAAPPILLFVGHLAETKGADHALLAAARVRHEHRLWFVGDGPLRGSLEKRAQAMGISAKVEFFGNVAPEVLLDLRAQSTLVLVPSLWPETFGMVGAESLSAGRPVIAYDAGGVSEWLEDGRSGRIVRAGDVDALARAVDDLLDRPALLRRMGRAGRTAALAWTPHHHATRSLEIYREALETVD